MKKILFILLFLGITIGVVNNAFALTIVAKVGNACHDPNSPRFLSAWRDGQIIEFQEDDKYIGTATRKNAWVSVSGYWSD